MAVDDAPGTNGVPGARACPCRRKALGALLSGRKRRGQLIGPYDLMIAGHARSRGLVVVTGNVAEFRRVDGLRCEDWLADPAGR